MRETVLIIEVPEAEHLVRDLRLIHAPGASKGIPAHITALAPFVRPKDFGAQTVATLRSVTRSLRPTHYQLTALDDFPNAIWLRPEPDQPFRDLTTLLHRAFPDYPPYRGLYPDSQPHLTIAESRDATALNGIKEQIASQLDRHLPLKCTASSLSVFMSDDEGEWRCAHRLAFGATA